MNSGLSVSIMSVYETYVFDMDLMNGSEGSGMDLEDMEEVCDIPGNQDFQKYFLPAVYGIIFILGIVGNGLVVLVMGFQKKTKNMTDKYRLHLSVADLLFVLTLPFWAVDAVSSWYFGKFMCVAVNMIYTVNLYSSVLILAFISLDRYLAVVRATNSQTTRKLLAERVIYVGVWLPAMLLTVPDLVFAKVEQTSTHAICDRFYPSDNNTTWKAVFRFQHILVGFVLPGLVILICYCIIISKLSKGSKGQTLKRKALKTTIILVLCFFVCWLPYCAGILVDTLVMIKLISAGCYLERVLQKWILITEALAYFHCCLNPILYAFLGVRFSKSARNALSINSRSSQKVLTKKRGHVSSVSTESESSSVLSS
ncbi:C-X-C chemokine receptor type 4b [Clarias gariepinus]|uniref:C-X-C chemokine receptor type 4b n=1 Tax=Clarias gariepinus TaxID=13013 RepID=UPI00234E035E|nr:C-X-C chemokine receptor type 4b [Clarias gariepinus]